MSNAYCHQIPAERKRDNEVATGAAVKKICSLDILQTYFTGEHQGKNEPSSGAMEYDDDEMVSRTKEEERHGEIRTGEWFSSQLQTITLQPVRVRPRPLVLRFRWRS